MIPLLIDALAVHRLARLVTEDTILTDPREAIVRAAYESAGRAEKVRPELDSDEEGPLPDAWASFAIDDPRAPKLAVLSICKWCAGMWCALAAVALRRFAPRLWNPLATALALSSAGALLAGLEKD